MNFKSLLTILLLLLVFTSPFGLRAQYVAKNPKQQTADSVDAHKPIQQQPQFVPTSCGLAPMSKPKICCIKPRPANLFTGTVYDLPLGIKGYSPDLMETLTPLGTFKANALDVPWDYCYKGFKGADPILTKKSNPNVWYAIVFEGQIELPEQETITWKLSSDDGSRLWIDGVEIINNDGIHGGVSLEQTTTLTAGRHNIKIWYYQGPEFHVMLQLEAKSSKQPAFKIFDISDYPLLTKNISDAQQLQAQLNAFALNHPKPQPEKASTDTISKSQPNVDSTFIAPIDLHQVFPNPTSGHVTVQLDLTDSKSVSLTLMTATGQHISTTDLGTMTQGNHQLPVQLTDTSGNALANGIYLLRISAGNSQSIHRIVLVK